MAAWAESALLHLKIALQARVCNAIYKYCRRPTHLHRHTRVFILSGNNYKCCISFRDLNRESNKEHCKYLSFANRRTILIVWWFKQHVKSQQRKKDSNRKRIQWTIISVKIKCILLKKIYSYHTNKMNRFSAVTLFTVSYRKFMNNFNKNSQCATRMS